MRVIKRSIWNVAKTTKKSVLLLLITSVVMTLILASLAIQKATSTATQQARKNVKGEVILENDFMKFSGDLQSGKIGWDDIEFLSSKIQQRLEQSKYVKEVNYEITGFLKSDYKTSAGERGGGFEDMPNNLLFSLTSIKRNADFSSGRLVLKEGELPKDSDATNPVLVSEDFLKLNNLEIGQELDVMGGPVNETPLKLTVVGVFEINTINEGQNDMQKAREMEQRDGFFATPETINKLSTLKSDGTTEESFFDRFFVTLTSGDDLDAFLDEFENYDDIDTSFIKAISDKDDIDRALGSIDTVRQVSNIIVIVSAIAAIVILGLIIMLSLRERKYELGILLSLGEKKRWLIGQIWLETMMIMIVSIGISLVLSIGVASSMQNSLTSNINKVEEKTNEETLNDAANSDSSIEVPKISINTMEPNNLLFGISMGLAIVCIATVVPTMLALKKDPKTLLLGRS